MSVDDSATAAGPEREKKKKAPDLSQERKKDRLHWAWRIGVAATLITGLFHLINLVGPSRGGFGPALVTPFRVAFFTTWALLLAGALARREWPSLDRADALVAALAAVFLFRGVFTPETLGITLNWVITGVGIFYLVKHGVRGRSDVRFVLAVTAVAIVALGLIGMAEYAMKENPLFDSIQIEAVGMDTRIGASDQFYRIRTLIGHPGFAGAIVVGGAPLIVLAFWRRRLLLAASLALMAAALLLTFSRGSWLLGALFFMPLLVYRARFWLRRNARWVAPAVLIPVVLMTIDYLRLERVSAHIGKKPVEDGLTWTKGNDGPYVVASGEADGVIPINRFLYFDVDDEFLRAGQGNATVIVHFFDRGTGAIHVEYDSWDENADKGGLYATSGYISKTDSHQWTTAAFHLENPRLDGRQNSGADFRIVDDERLVIIDEVVFQKGRLKLPTVIAQQWQSRAGSFSARTDLYPLAWSVIRDNPLGVGLYNSPGTNHHAVDSLPLTWMMEFGWLSVPLLAALLFGFVREGMLVFKSRSGPAAVLFLSLALLLLHGGHLMVLYDKPSLILFASVGALYSLVRPWRHHGPVLVVSNRDCML